MGAQNMSGIDNVILWDVIISKVSPKYSTDNHYARVSITQDVANSARNGHYSAGSNPGMPGKRA